MAETTNGKNVKIQWLVGTLAALLTFISGMALNEHLSTDHWQTTQTITNAKEIAVLQQQYGAIKQSLDRIEGALVRDGIQSRQTEGGKR
ncbi:MAG: hypothetical protein C4570_04265 [Ammonifex sp.]|nr:MAG: hypothetical protein C4570_04265 [Ammonifex sp.]